MYGRTIWGSFFILPRSPPASSPRKGTPGRQVNCRSGALSRKAARGLAPQRIYNPPKGPAYAA